MTLRDDILAAIKPREEKVQIDGAEVTVRELASAADVLIFADRDAQDAKLVLRCVFDAQGARVFQDEDLEAIKAGSLTKMLPLIEACRRVNGLSVADNEKK